MRFIPKEIDYKQGWKEANAAMDRNRDLLQKIDQDAKAKGELLWRYIQEQVADGYAIYQIVKVNKKSVRIVHCEGMGDDYFVSYWGGEATIDMDYALTNLGWRDKLDELFSDKGVSNKEI